MKERQMQYTPENEQSFHKEFVNFRRKEKSLLERAKGAGEKLLLAFMIISAGVGNSARFNAPTRERSKKSHYSKKA